MSGTAAAIDIEPWTSARHHSGLVAGLNAIFFESSATQSFASDAERSSFHTRWLGRYLENFPDCAFIGIGRDGRAAGYVAGSLNDPARTQLFSDIGYFERLAHATCRYPAQLHVNVRHDLRGAGLGARLVERFAAHAKAEGAPGVHIVTARGMRNAAFYTRIGFAEVASVIWNGRELVMMGRRLSP